MTFNLRYASHTPPNSWPERRPVTLELLRQVAPDVIGTQEGFYHQIKEIAEARPEYAWIGTGRDGGSKGEFAAIFYRHDRLEPLEFDHFWLSDTPNVIASRTWGNNCVRMCTWVRFRDRATGHEFTFWNTHLDHELQSAREKGAALILDRINALATDVPVILVGDFNAHGGANKTYDILIEGGFTDAWLAAGNNASNGNTYHDYGPQENGIRIDWILTRGEVKALEAEVITYEQNTQRPSDHFPVAAVLQFGQSNA